ncbi:MAG: hypothetical protein K8U03_21655 [Planctomycetia bacterium]|nr:hypothetical protein [Planctomycetia bacterium]
MLYHISEDAHIARFEPRRESGRELNTDRAVVWAVDGERRRNYLLPRDCPRVTFYPHADTQPADIERFLGASQAVVAIEATWLERVRRTRLYCYHLPAATFACVDPCAGYFQSTEAVVPEFIESIDDPLAALQSRGVEIRILPSLWTLHDAVLKSTLRYSMIRLRNATPRDNSLPFP